MVGVVSRSWRRWLGASLAVVAIAGCGPAATASPAGNPVAAQSNAPTPSSLADAQAVVLLGRIVTMDDPPVAEALLIADGKAAAVGTRSGGRPPPRRGAEDPPRRRLGPRHQLGSGDAGLHVASATDAPWTFPDSKLTEDMGRPVDHVAAGMDCRVRTSPDPPAWSVDQLLSAEQALRTVTVEAAWAIGDESRRGHLAPGTMGDVTILRGDIATSTPDEIRALEVVATVVGGIVVYCSDAAICGGPR